MAQNSLAVKIRRKHNNYESECSLEEKQVWGSEKFRLSSTKARSSFLLWSSGEPHPKCQASSNDHLGPKDPVAGAEFYKGKQLWG